LFPISSKDANRATLRPYWLGLGLFAILIAAYLAIILALHTETATRSTAPPWYSWLRIPLTRTPRQCTFLVFPLIVFAGWSAIIRQTLRRPIPDLLFLLYGFFAVLLLNVTVSMMDGNTDAIWKPFSRRSEYFQDVSAVHAIVPFLRGYVQNLHLYSLHTRTHPPGAVLLLYLSAQILGPGIKAAAWTAIVIAASGIVPFYLLARRLSGPRIASLAMALYALTPSLVLFGATSMDGVFLVPLLWSIYFLQRAITENEITHAIAAGLTLTISLMFSYVTVCVGAMMFIYAILEWLQNKKSLAFILRSLAICIAIIAAVLAAIYFLTGFNYLACFARSRFYDHYTMQTFSIPFGRSMDISFSNLLAFLIGLGLPIVVLWARETIGSFNPSTAAHRFNIAAILSVLTFSFAHLFTHETERIWLFFIPPPLIASANWIARQGSLEQRLLKWAMGLMLLQTMLFQWILFTIW
jgi:hypothetical protein